jgi:hypothetical protein
MLQVQKIRFQAPLPFLPTQVQTETGQHRSRGRGNNPAPTQLFQHLALRTTQRQGYLGAPLVHANTMKQI